MANARSPSLPYTLETSEVASGLTTHSRSFSSGSLNSGCQRQATGLASRMVEKTLDELQAEVEGSTLPDARKAELLQRVTELREMEQEASHGPVTDLVAAIDGMEASHPKITELVNRLATFFGNLGI